MTTRAEEQEPPEELPGGNAEHPPLDFNTFILSLSTSALMSMGVAQAEGGADPVEKNLPLAKQTIELIGLIEERTRGNLSGEEERLISQVLHDLRVRYMRAYRATEVSGEAG